MENNLSGNVMSPVLHEITKKYRAGEMSLKCCKELISFCVNAVDDYDGDLESMFSLVDNMCTVCFEDFKENELVSWNPKEDYDARDVRSKYVEVAFNNCFGNVMVGGNVCLHCVSQLAKSTGGF